MRVLPFFRARWRRRWLARLLPWLPEAYEEIWVYMNPLKTPEALDQFRAFRMPNVIPVRYVMYRHQVEGRFRLREGEGAELVPLAEAEALNGCS